MPDARDAQTALIIGAAIDVHRELGRGFLEQVYRRPMELELRARNVPFQREAAFPVIYKGVPTGVSFRVDLLCFGEIVVELKALSEITGGDVAQVINYLHVAKLRRGLLLNFGTPRLGIQRVVHTPEHGTTVRPDVAPPGDVS